MIQSMLPRPSLVLWVATMLAVSAESAIAQRMPAGKTDLILSKGATIHRIDDPQHLPGTFNEIHDDKLIVPVAAGQFLMRFKSRFLRSVRGKRYLVVTEDGVWGYLKENPRLYAGEHRLRAIATSNTPHGMIRSTYREVQDAMSITLGRGEIYRIEEFPEDVDGVHYKISLSDDKRADIEAVAKRHAGNEGFEPPSVLLVPEHKIDLIDIHKFLPVDVNFDTSRGNSRKEYEKIYAAWKKFKILPKAQFVKVCGERIFEVDENRTSGEFKVSAGLNIDTIWKTIKAGLGFSGQLETDFKEEVKRAVEFDPQKEIRTKMWIFQSQNKEKSYFVRIVGDCSSEHWHEIGTPDQGQWEIDKDVVKHLFANTEGIKFESSAGHISIKCYADDFLKGSVALMQQFNLQEHEAFFVLSRITRLKDWRQFFKC